MFKSAGNGRYFITSIRLRLSKQFCPHLDYAGLQEELEDAGVAPPRAEDVFRAVVRLRQKKLPDPAAEGNAGSFFKNPLVPLEQAESLRGRFPGLPVWNVSQNEARISAAWMIDQCALKGYRHHGAAVSDRHALVLLNRNQASGLDIWQLARRVQEKVRLRFGVELEPEPTIYLGPTKDRQV
jgi:UDP-N-acetylmuramate dehydrogenase